MSDRSAALTSVTGFAVALYLLAVGGALWHDAPTPADAAAGKGLCALAGAAAIVAFFSLTAALEAQDRGPANAEHRPARPDVDWYDG